MIKPGLTLLLWLAFATLLVVNNMIGDTWIGMAIGPRLAAWYKVVVPLPYAALLAIFHARHTAGPQWLPAALVAAVAWPLSTGVLDALYGRFTFGEEASDLLDRYGILWGAPFPWLLLAQAILPVASGWALARALRLAPATNDGEATLATSDSGKRKP